MGRMMQCLMPLFHYINMNVPNSPNCSSWQFDSICSKSVAEEIWSSHDNAKNQPQMPVCIRFGLIQGFLWLYPKNFWSTDSICIALYAKESAIWGHHGAQESFLIHHNITTIPPRIFKFGNLWPNFFTMKKFGHNLPITPNVQSSRNHLRHQESSTILQWRYHKVRHTGQISSSWDSWS